MTITLYSIWCKLHKISPNDINNLQTFTKLILGGSQNGYKNRFIQ